MNKNIAFVVASWLAICASASDQNNGYKGTVQIGELCAQQYVPSKTSCALATASSPSYLASLNSRLYDSAFQIFDRTNNYAYLFALKNRFPNNITCQAAIVDDTLLVTTVNSNNGLWIDNIHTITASKEIKLNKIGNIYSLNTMPNKTGCLSFVHNGCVVMNLDTEQAEHSFNTNDDAYIQYSIPTKDGNGIWYRATQYIAEPKKAKIGFYDIRSGKAQLLAIELPPFHGRISANPSNTRCAFVSSGQLLIYDVVANKKDVTIFNSTEEHVKNTFFANDNTLIYHTENTLHTLTFSTSPIIQRASSKGQNFSSFYYHDHTQLLITSHWTGSIDAIYDFNNKQ